jgi:hypothetical protein
VKGASAAQLKGPRGGYPLHEPRPWLMEPWSVSRTA